VIKTYIVKENIMVKIKIRSFGRTTPNTGQDLLLKLGIVNKA